MPRITLPDGSQRQYPQPLSVAEVAADPILAHCGWTPFQGRAFRHAVRSTVVSGQLAWHEGQLHNDCQGLPLRYQRG